MSIYRGKTTREVYLASLLYDAIDDEDINSINTFLEKGADCNLVLPRTGISAFHLVIGKESEEFATNYTILLLQNKADPNVRTNDGLTPLHIAAAYGRASILYTLLCCGGNTELRDINYKTPVDYAREYDNKECIDLLLSFMEKPSVFNRTDLNPAFNLTLEKIMVENGGQQGEFEIVHEYKTEPLTQQNLESLHRLPETDTTEYVMNWCQNQLQTSSLPAPEKPPNSLESSCNNSDFRESSCDESDGGKSVSFKDKQGNITFRKRYRKVRKIGSVSGVSNVSDNKKSSPSVKTPQDKQFMSVFRDNSNTGMFSALCDFSKESGIMTLPNSRNDFLNADDKKLSLSPREVNSLPVIDTTVAESSDYRTCSPCDKTTTPRILHENVFEITNDTSLITPEEGKSRRSSTKSEGVLSTEMSFVSVSEVYKYIDEAEGIVLFEKRLLKATTSDYAGSIRSSSLSSKLSSVPASADYDTDTLRKELTTHGYNPGPITFTTKRIYLRKLKQIKRHPLHQIPNETNKKMYSVELEKTIRDQNWLKDAILYKSLEEVLVKEFSSPSPSRKWREGVNKMSFTYLLLDPRITNNLPCRAETMDPKEMWEVFLSSIFYVGKGKRSRPYSHLYEAVNLWKEGKKHSPVKKLNKILSIWNDNFGVICLHVFQNVIPVEAYTREAAIISALKSENLSNIKGGEFYGIASTWPQKQKKMLGVYLLYKAMMIFMNEGERQLCPTDIE